MPVPAGHRPSDDPLDEVLRPPPDETPEQRQIRLEREAEAKRISLEIDATIKAERQARRKKRIVRLLLLGQSESGEFESSGTALRGSPLCSRKIYHPQT
jgi:guanine nucleotide-binding protein subunit alpha